MDNIFKQFVYTGVGLFSQSLDKAKELVDKLVEDGKVSAVEGKKIVEEFNKNKDTKKEELETQFSSLVEKIVKSFKFAANKDVSELVNRVTVLEAVLANRKDAQNSEAADKSLAKKPAKAKKPATKNNDADNKEQ
jgi:polyhydroxyalkanoate synthesis regulator phasin